MRARRPWTRKWSINIGLRQEAAEVGHAPSAHFANRRGHRTRMRKHTEKEAAAPGRGTLGRRPPNNPDARGIGGAARPPHASALGNAHACSARPPVQRLSRKHPRAGCGASSRATEAAALGRLGRGARCVEDNSSAEVDAEMTEGGADRQCDKTQAVPAARSAWQTAEGDARGQRQHTARAPLMHTAICVRAGCADEVNIAWSARTALPVRAPSERKLARRKVGARSSSGGADHHHLRWQRPPACVRGRVSGGSSMRSSSLASRPPFPPRPPPVERRRKATKRFGRATTNRLRTLCAMPRRQPQGNPTNVV